MRPFSPKSLLSLSSSTPLQSPRPYAILISHFSTSSTHHHSLSYPSRRHEEESRNVRVSVWWDFENCHLPVGANVFKVAQAITAAVRGNGIMGPIHITAFGDTLQLSRANQEALSSTGINLTHIPNGGKNSADRSLLVDLMYWVSKNPPPAHLFLISGDRDFASILHRLRMNNYNILLASTDAVPGVLCSAASIMWNWNSLVRGENVTGKHFNQPPDGPYGSWYGQYQVPLEDPFSIVTQPACSQTDDLSEPSSDPKLRPIPKTVIKQIRHLLSLYPKGISITELRAELGKTNLSLDKDLYGYKRFSRFLQSMTDILRLQYERDGQFLVRAVPSRAPEPFNNVDQGPKTSLKYNAEGISTGSMNEKSSVPPATLPDVKIPSGKVPQPPPTAENTVEVLAKQTAKTVSEPPPPAENTIKEAVKQTTKEVQKPLPVDMKVLEVINTQETKGNSSPKVEQNSASEVGLLKRIWKRWFGSNAGGSGMKSGNIPDKINISEGSSENIHKTARNCCTNVDTSEKIENGERCAELQRQKVAVSPAMHSLSAIESTLDNKTTKSSEIHGEKSSTSSGFFSRIVNWCKFRSGSDPNTSSDQHSAALNQSNSSAGKHEIFALNSFWVDMESFIGTTRGSLLIFGSRSREQMAQNFQKKGPSVLKALSKSDLLQLVDMLISERKWVEECTSQEFPFMLAQCFQKNYSSGTSSQPVRKKIPVEDQEKTVHNILHVEAASLTGKKSSDRSRSEIKADCQNLLNEVLKNHPEGYNIGSFRKLFRDRYGYYLDLQRLGYKKLVDLLLTMPGVRIESTYIIPSGKTWKSSRLDAGLPTVQENNARVGSAYSSSELSDSHSPWDELGPVDDMNSGRKRPQGVSMKNVKERYADYGSTSSDDVFSDSDEETSAVMPKAQGKPTTNEEDSPLLQVLGSWYSSKEGEKGEDNFGNVDGMVDGSKNGLKLFGSSGTNTKSETSSVDHGKSPKPQRTYSFVQDSVENEKDKLIDNILGSLKKSGDSGMQN
ncbi:uncharacterized protein LOC120005176 isoform X2 [Tripterygium wilfordii]|uniref:uncharacterized protein LOC120005176 isoform X2 n=1 Tax=Tripterygium wilfordii TaxID=458696 RepID=UPI0018F85E39|nr:uncharacterized protein LOC120005176 isoform X2 [Tripterygium wilfordii]